MIGRLPQSLKIGCVDYKIRTDYRDCLVILQAFTDPDLSEKEKLEVMVEILYEELPEIETKEVMEEVLEKAVWFLNCGNTISKPNTNKPLYDFEHDEQILFASLNNVAGKELRLEEYVHFWTFCGYFNEIGEGTFSTVIGIRQKKQKGKKLEKYEQDYYYKNKEMIDLPHRYSEQEQEEINELLSLF